jgi:hypothetical protein
VVQSFRSAAEVLELIVQVIIPIIVLFKVLIGSLKGKKMVKYSPGEVEFWHWFDLVAKPLFLILHREFGAISSLLEIIYLSLLFLID